MNKKEIVEKYCELCGNPFQINLNNKRLSKKRFCSGHCAKKYNGLKNKGKKRTEKFKKELSIKMSGEKNPFYGKKHTTQSKEKMSISSQWTDEKYKYCNLTEKEKEIFDGIIISDGCLNSSRISGRLSLGFKYLETLNRIIEDLPSMKFIKPWTYTIHDKRTNKDYINYYTKSCFYRDLLQEYNKWYNIQGKKIIPKDIILTPLLCYWWFVCDGYVVKNNVYLCTDSYEKNEILELIDKFQNLNFKCNLTSKNRIRFYKKDSGEFLKWISKNIEIQKEYLYKWEKYNYNL